MIALPLLLVLCISGRGLAAADRPQVVLWIVADDLVREQSQRKRAKKRGVKW